MKILFDHQAFTIQRFGGISRYFHHLITELQAFGDAECALPVLFSNNENLPAQMQPPARPFFPGKDFKGKYQLQRTLNNWKSRQTIRQGSFDIFHPTYYDNYFLDVLKGNKPFVITVYDLIHELFAATYPELNREKATLQNKYLLLQKAERVIAISHSTKKDLVQVYKIDPAKIDVAHLASSFSEQDGKAQTQKEGYILFVGNRGMYKNFPFFLEVVAGFLKQYNLQLVCAGSAPFSESERESLQRLGVQDRVVHKRVYNDQVLAGLYRKALFFVFPSLYEGFGIPILEALQTGCPALVSNTSSFPEVGGDAVLYFDPTDQHSLASALDMAINDETLRNRMMADGLERNKQFTWKQCAAQTLATYREAL